MKYPDRPRCQHKRPQDVIVGKGPEAHSVRQDRPCGYLLDKTGECWFCRKVNRALRHEWNEQNPPNPSHKLRRRVGKAQTPPSAPGTNTAILGGGS